MNEKHLVVDANIFIAALLKDGTTRQTLLAQNRFLLYSPSFLKQEIAKYLPVFSERLNAPISELKPRIKELIELSKITIVRQKKYKQFLLPAQQISPDPHDSPYFALAIMLECPIWSHDKALKKQETCAVYTTHELVWQIQKSQETQ